MRATYQLCCAGHNTWGAQRAKPENGGYMESLAHELWQIKTGDSPD